ncbi:MAG: SCO family protein [Opitutae bacterium]|nr:SCO family protein [Opitutae bacterium]
MNLPRLIPLACLALAALAGCTRKQPAATGPMYFYSLTGTVVDLAPARHAAIIHHEEIPGYMPPMTMEFIVADADLARLKEGLRLRARLLPPDAKGELHLEAIEILDPLKEQQLAAAANLLRQDTSARGKSAYREVGETVPQFVLYNQEGEIVPINRFRGKRVVMNFIYTRCPIATMCPASTQRMMALQQAAKARAVRDLELVSITLDPAYDTPPVLKDYASVRGIDTGNFSFLTGPEGAVRDLLVQFGIIVEPGENYLKHTLSTLLIDERGRIVHRVDGTQWRPEEFLSRLK